MPERNVEIVRRAAEAFSRGDWDQMLADFAGPDFEYVTSGMIPGTGGIYRGVDEFRRVFLEGFVDEFDDFHSHIHEIIQSRDQVLVSLTVSGRGRQSGAETSWSYFQVWTVRDGKVRHGRGFPERIEALEAVGLTEQDIPHNTS